MIFRKIGRKSIFGGPIGLNHLVFEYIGLGGHFGVFTTHTTHFFTLFGECEEDDYTSRKW